MRRENFKTVMNLAAEDPLTDSQIRELTNADKDDVVDVDQAAAMLGVSSDTVIDWAKKKKFPGLHTNSQKRLFMRRDIRAYRDALIY